MNKLLLKATILWILCSILMVCLVYFFHGDSIILLPLDIKYSFIDNRSSLYMMIGLELFFILLWIYIILNYKNLIQLRWHVRIGKIRFIVGTCKILYRYIHAFILAALAGILILATLMIGRQTMVDLEWESYSVIAHAMGGIDGIDYTNSLEAFESHYELGNRVFEVDFKTTLDNELVACHDWNQGYQEGIDGNNVPTKEIFARTPILGRYTPLTLEDILSLMRDYEDIYIVTDTKSRNTDIQREIFKIIYETAVDTGTTEVLDRLVVQIYSDQLLETVREFYDYPSIIYTLYLDWDGETKAFLHYCRFCKNNNINIITMWDYLATPEVMQIANDYNIDIYVHTVNDLEEAQELMNIGVKGIYTDILTPDSLKEDGKQ